MDILPREALRAILASSVAALACNTGPLTLVEDQLCNILLDLFSAGSDTTSNSIGKLCITDYLFCIRFIGLYRRICTPLFDALSGRPATHARRAGFRVWFFASYAGSSIPVVILNATRTEDFV